MRDKTVKTFQVTIYMGGDINTAKQICRKYCQKGLCITIEPTTYIYTGGEEEGFKIGLVNYPRFISNKMDIRLDALQLAREVRDGCCQDSFLIVDSDKTRWISKREG